MQGPRTPETQELAHVVDFLNHSLRPDQTWSISSEYPTALHPQNIHNMRIITDEKKILAHAVLRPLIVRTPQIIYKVATIGSVVTEESHRGQGLSTQIIQDCLTNAQSQNCDFAILWTNLFDFYRKLGFELAGTEISFELASDFQYPSGNLRFLKNTNIAPEALYRLYSQHTVQSVRTLEDFRKYLQIPNTQIYTAWKEDGSLGAYAIEGKGIDLKGYLHEWGGGTQELLALLSYVNQSHGSSPIVVITPEHAQNLNKKLLSLKTTMTQGFLGMIKITNFAQLSQKIKKAFRNEGVNDFVLEKTPKGPYLFGFSDQLFTLEREQDVVQLLFGPVQYEKLELFHPENHKKILAVLPLKLWLWGWDSI